MASRCIKVDYEQAHCLIEVTREQEARTPTHVAVSGNVATRMIDEHR